MELGRQGGPVGVVVVEAASEDIEEPGEGVGSRRGHGTDAPKGRPPPA
jgi:hypothetical protein